MIVAAVPYVTWHKNCLATWLTRRLHDATIERLDVAAYTIPTDAPESDGTLAWQSTTLVLVYAWAGEQWGLDYTYADTATAALTVLERLGYGVILQRGEACRPSDR